MTSIIAIAWMIYLAHGMLTARKIDIFLQETPQQIIEDLNIENYVQEITCVKEDECLHFNFEVKDEFENLSTFEQFGFFHLFSKQLRFRMLHMDQIDKLLNENFSFTAEVNNQALEFDVNIPEGSIKLLKTNDTLRINNEIVYTLSEYLSKVDEISGQMELDYVNGYSAAEIMKFAIRINDLITIDGADVNELRKSARLVTNAVLEEFGITYDQYVATYKKYYFCLHTIK